MKNYFDDGAKFIHDAISSGGKVLVHCGAGISRSTTLLCAYFIRFKQMKFADSLKLI